MKLAIALVAFLVACGDNVQVAPDAGIDCQPAARRGFVCKWRQACGGQYDVTVQVTVEADSQAGAELELVDLCEATVCPAAHACSADCSGNF